MMTVKQVSEQTGVSVRTLQFYDEIGLLKPTALTEAGYRLYDGRALELLQQILFFKELDFTLREIKAILENPAFDRTAAYQKQRELLRLKRDRLNGLLGLLDKLIEGDACMELQKFDMSRYFQALEDFRATHAEAIVQRLGSMEDYDAMLAELKTQEDELAEFAVKQYGSVEGFTEAMKRNFRDFLAHGSAIPAEAVGGLTERTEALTSRLLADRTRNPASAEVQAQLRALIDFTEACSGSADRGEGYWPAMAELYAANPAFIEATDKKYGAGAARYLSLALRAYLGGQ